MERRRSSTIRKVVRTVRRADSTLRNLARHERRLVRLRDRISSDLDRAIQDQKRMSESIDELRHELRLNSEVVVPGLTDANRALREQVEALVYCWGLMQAGGGRREME